MLALTMSLNKRTGLYSMPSHHRHGAKPAPRPSFNSMDFAAEDEPSPGGEEQSVQQVEAPRSTFNSMDFAQQAYEEITPPQARKDKKKKKKKKQSISADGQLLDNRTPTASTPQVKVTPASASTQGKKDKKATKSDKKRKRAGEAQADAAPKPHHDFGFGVGADMLQNVESSVKAAGEVFKFSSPTATANVTGEPRKKKSKKDKAGRESGDTIDFDLMANETRSINRDVKKEAKARARRFSAGAVQAREPAPPIFSSPLPRKTPVPLPPNAFSRAVNASKADRTGRRDSRLVVVETPSSELPKTPTMLPDSPIPFKLTEAAKKKGPKSSNKAVGLSPPAPSSAPPAVKKTQTLEPDPDSRVSLTTSNLIKYTNKTQPLSDGSKPKPLSRAVSTAGSTTSSGTTPSVKEVFARVGEPYSRSGAEVDPHVVVPKPRKKATLETHDEASAAEFTSRFRAAQHAVNFSHEREYMSQSTAWRTANSGPLPCLGQKASGCNTKRETILQLNRSDPTSHLTVQVASAADAAALVAAKERVAVAESLLALSLAARVPVPLGPIQGTWRLFCPAYAADHVDRYGYGQRTLCIVASSPASSSNNAKTSTPNPTTYTACLSIPPRSMLYPLRPFTPPPHASFRATTLQTTAEGYSLDLVFLGNGYALLRVDLQLLLSGKEGGGEGRSAVMEFVGVHEGAVVWGDEGEGRVLAGDEGEG